MFITYFCYRCESKQFGALSVEEFSRGLASFNANTIKEIKSHVIKIKEDLLNITTEDFRKFYYFLFEYNLPVKTKKLLDYDYVELYFNLLFGHQFKIVAKFLDYMAVNKKKENVKQDQWNCFLDFLIKIGDNFPKGYSTKDSWPTLFDEFYLFYCEKNDINPYPDEDF